ncbi:MAG TPA: DUF1573 domain-containing protein [Ignavibacteriaceae bacterium]|jgi:uncharacterized cupredoxin-like copper-binding protein|nr:DUF1573 domain-containing protein [Ignavibacteriaceae bacterium]
MIRTLAIIFLLAAISIFPQMGEPKVSVQQTEFDFGDINQNDIVNHSFVITNTGNDLLKISDIRASCGCTAATPDKNELKPGESTKLTVTFNSKGRKGPQVKTVSMKTNDPNKQVLTLMIKCNILVKEDSNNNSGAMIFFPEVQHDFGKVKEGEVLKYNFKFENKGTQPLLIKDVKTSCGCTAAVVSEKNLSPGKSGAIKVEFDTKNRQGKVSKTVTVVSNDNNEPNKVITIYADISKN